MHATILKARIASVNELSRASRRVAHLGGVLAALLAVLCAGSAMATGYSWNNGAGGSWTTLTNWTPNVDPNSASDTVSFANIGGPYVATLSAARTIGGLNFVLGATDPTLTINNTLTVSGGTSDIIGGAINGTGTLSFTNSAVVNWSAPAAGGTLSYLIPSLVASHTVNINNTASTFAVGSGQTLQVGNIATLNTAKVTFANGFTNNGEIRLGVKQPPVTDVYGTFQLFTTNGTLTNNSGANINFYARSNAVNTTVNTREVNSSVQNDGTITVYNTDAFLGGAGKTVTNTGTIATDHSSYTFASSVPKVTITGNAFTNTGALNVGANHGGLGGGYMIIRSNTIDLNSGTTITGPGTLELGGTAVTINPGTTITGLTTLAFGQANNVSTAVNWAIPDLVAPMNFKIVSGGDVTLTRATDWALPSNQVFWMDATGGAIEPMTFTMAKNFSNSGEVRMGRTPDAGDNYATQSLILSGANVFTNNSDGVVNMYVRAAALDSCCGERYISANVVNNGVINAYSSHSGLGTAGKTLVNNNTINVSSAEYVGGIKSQLQLLGTSFTNNSGATINLNSGRLWINTTTFNYDGGAITTNAGSEIMLGSTNAGTNFIFNGGAEITGPVIFRSSADAQNTITRTSTWNILSNQELRFDTPGSAGTTRLTSNQDMTNSGLIRMGNPTPGTDNFIDQSLRINSTNSRLTNNANGQIDMYPRCANCLSATNDNPWSIRRLEGELVNNGQFNIYTRFGNLGKAGANHVNNGTITLDKSFYQLGTTGFTPALAVTGTSLLNGTAGVIRGNGILNVTATTFNNAGTLSPGLSAGILTVQGNVNNLSGGKLAIEITGSGDVAGVDYDQLIVTGGFNGLTQADLVVNIGSLNYDLTGDVFTILTSTTNFTGSQFHSVTFTGPDNFRGDILYGNGFISISNISIIPPVPEPGTGCLLLLGLVAVRRRQRQAEAV